MSKFKYLPEVVGLSVFLALHRDHSFWFAWGWSFGAVALCLAVKLAIILHGNEAAKEPR